MRGRARPRVGYGIGFAAAILFGASTPFANRLADGNDPQFLAGLLYLGAFAAVGLGARRPGRALEARIVRSDLVPLAGLILSGGVIAPLLLMLGLRRLDAVPASLLLNLEGPFTVLVGVTLFREHLGRRASSAAFVVFLGAGVLTIAPTGLQRLDPVGVLLIVGACGAWGIDNNLTQHLTLRDPFAIVLVKTGVAAAINLSIATARGSVAPGRDVVAATLLVGAVSFGISILLDAYALRLLGAAREAAIFATAPVAGVVIAILVYGEGLGVRDVVGAAIMAAGTVTLLRAKHDHEHTHPPAEHEHRHVHDEHHQHDHEAGVVMTEPHSHRHDHARLVHRHAHVSDLHHRHPHDEA